MTLVASLRTFFSDLNAKGVATKTYWIAYSGGLDSHVLLTLCYLLRTEMALDLRAIHINHGLSPHANQWAAHCAEICKHYDIPFIEKNIQLHLLPGESIEEVAREKRYEIFADCLQENEILLTAHHEDDQAETLLMQLFRGAGLKGLASMPPIKTFARGFHARPLLIFSRAELKAYAESAQLKWIEDEMNEDVKLTRNFIRHDILSQLKIRWPTITTTISRTALHCAEAENLLQAFAMASYKETQGSLPNTLSVEKLSALSVMQQRLILRTWIEQLGFSLPNTKKLNTILQSMLTAKKDRLPHVSWGNVEMRRYRDDLYIMKVLNKDTHSKTYQWDFEQTLILPELGQLSASLQRGKGIRSDIKEVSIRFRQGGEAAHLRGKFTHTLKNLFQTWKIPPWQRQRIPLIYIDEKLIGAVGYFIDPAFAVKANEMGWEIVLQ